MKALLQLRLAVGLLLLSVAGLSTACESKPATQQSSATPADSTQPVVAAAYICPMACEGSASDKPGKCPVCEMTLERNPDYKAAVQ